MTPSPYVITDAAPQAGWATVRHDHERERRTGGDRRAYTTARTAADHSRRRGVLTTTLDADGMRFTHCCSQPRNGAVTLKAMARFNYRRRRITPVSTALYTYRVTRQRMSATSEVATVRLRHDLNDAPVRWTTPDTMAETVASHLRAGGACSMTPCGWRCVARRVCTNPHPRPLTFDARSFDYRSGPQEVHRAWNVPYRATMNWGHDERQWPS